MKYSILNAWEELQEDVRSAVQEGYDNHYHMQERTEQKGRFEAYRYILDKMETLTKNVNY